MGKHYLARFFRLCYRLILVAGVLLAFGTTALLGYMVLSAPTDGGGPSLFKDSEDVVEDNEGAQNTQSPQAKIKTSHLIWLLILLGGMAIGAVVSTRQVNNFIRRSIARLAHALGMPIFHMELSLACLVWSTLIIILNFSVPEGAIVAAVFLGVNLICSVLAWLLYGRAKYCV